MAIPPKVVVPSSGVSTVRSIGSSTGSMPTSRTFDCSTDTLSSTTMRRNDGLEAGVEERREAGAHRVPR